MEGDGVSCVTAHVGKRWPWRSLLAWSKARGNRVGMTPSSGTDTGADVLSVAGLEVALPCFPCCHQPLQPHNFLPCCHT